MADESSTELPVVSETVRREGSRVEGSLGGPIVHIDWIGNHSRNGEIVSFALEAFRHMTVGATTHRDRVVVAHLRMPMHTMMALKAAIEQVELMTKPPAGGQKN